MTPADLRDLIAAMREYPSAYASNNDNLAAFAYGVLVGAGDDRVRAAWRAAVAHVLYPDDHGSMEPKWWKYPASRVVDVFEHAAFSLDLTTDAPNESPIVDLILRAQTEADPDRHCHAIARRGYPLVADVAKRSREALDAATKPVATTSLPDAGVVKSQTFAFDDPPPSWHPYATREEWEAAVNRTAGILAGAIDPAAEARQVAVKRARAMPRS